MNKFEDLLIKVINNKEIARSLLDDDQERYNLMMALGKEVSLQSYFMEYITGSAVYNIGWYAKDEFRSKFDSYTFDYFE